MKTAFMYVGVSAIHVVWSKLRDLTVVSARVTIMLETGENRML